MRGRPAWLEVLTVSLRLGLTSFGGPVAHLGYQRRAFVEQRGWLDDRAFAELVALCQALPGPGSSQLSLAVGRLRAGWPGAIAAWVGFTLPSALLMGLLGVLVARAAVPEAGPVAGAVAGLKAAAVAVVAQALIAMARRLTPDVPRLVLAAGAAVVALAIPVPAIQPGLIVLGAVLGWLGLGERETAPRDGTSSGTTDGTSDARATDPRATDATRDRAATRATSDARATDAAATDGGATGMGRGDPTLTSTRREGGRRTAVALGAAWLALVTGSLVLAARTTEPGVAFFAALVRAGALVFGGGHVVLPLLDTGVVTPGWVTPDAFLAGYGAAQAVPGPLFSFGAYLGAVASVGPGGLPGAALATVAIFLPGMLLLLAALPVLRRLRDRPAIAAALAGTNAVVVGLLAAALVTPVGTGGLTSPAAVVLAALGFVGLASGRVAPLVVVAGCAAAMALLAGAGVRV